MNRNVSIKTYAIIEDKGRLLLTKDLGKKGWKLPGGKLEKGELLDEAVKREVKEETSLKVTPTSLVHVQHYLKPDGGLVIRFYFSAKMISGKLKPQAGEVEYCQWVPRRELLNLTRRDFFLPHYYLAVLAYLKGGRSPLPLAVKPLRD